MQLFDSLTVAENVGFGVEAHWAGNESAASSPAPAPATATMSG